MRAKIQHLESINSKLVVDLDSAHDETVNMNQAVQAEQLRIQQHLEYMLKHENDISSHVQGGGRLDDLPKMQKMKKSFSAMRALQ